MVYADPAGEYMQRTEAVRDTKRRLGTDSWGGSDQGVRDILDPMDAVMDREFPDYEPYPWGRRQHIFRLVRHILLTEPLSERFGRLFEGASAGDVEELASAFRSDRTIQRRPLVDILRRRSGTE